MTDQVKAQSGSATTEKYKIKVGGVEKELTYEQLIEAAQKGDDYERKTKDLSEKRKELETELSSLGEWKSVKEKIEADPKLRATLSKTISDYESGRISKSEDVKDRNLKLLDKKIEAATDPEVRENLKEVRQIILEETADVSKVKEELIAVKEELASLRSNTNIGIADRIETQLTKLSDSFGKDLVDKYAKEIRVAAAKYPTQSAEKLFIYYASSEDAETAILNKHKKEKEKEHQRKENGSSVGVGSTQTKIEPARNKKGRIDWTAQFQKMKEAGRFR